MQFVNTNQPIHEADEAEQEQMERRDEQLHLACGKFRASRKNDRFVNESCNGQEIADPNFRQVPRQLVGGQNFVRWWFHVVSSSSNAKKKSIGAHSSRQTVRMSRGACASLKSTPPVSKGEK